MVQSYLPGGANVPTGTAHWRHLVNTIELVLPSAHPTPQPNGISIGSAVSAQLMAESPYTLQWVTLSLKIAPLRGGIWCI